MVRDAEAHADKDRERKEMIEARNEADTLAYSVEKSLIEYKVGMASVTKASICCTDHCIHLRSTYLLHGSPVRRQACIGLSSCELGLMDHSNQCHATCLVACALWCSRRALYGPLTSLRHYSHRCGITHIAAALLTSLRHYSWLLVV
jgi:hypothetical protein